MPHLQILLCHQIGYKALMKFPFPFLFQFEERGPYVYTEYETREDVNFCVSEVTYRVSRRHVFNAVSTAKECATCTVNDTVSKGLLHWSTCTVNDTVSRPKGLLHWSTCTVNDTVTSK